jgi:hypothetical protein
VVIVHRAAHHTVIEVDGHLGLVAAHDLRRAYAGAERDGGSAITMDLSRVAAADPEGIAALDWCVRQAVATGTTLTWSTCSRPLAASIDAEVRAGRARRQSLAAVGA